MELPAEAFCHSIEQGLTALRACDGCSFDDVAAITFATQTNSFVLLDANDRPLTSLILWPDERAKAMEAEVRRRGETPDFRAKTGIPELTFEFMVAKLLWLQEESPETWKPAARIDLISDYLTFLMTGRHVTEAGAAGLTGLLDIHSCQWRPTMLASFGLSASQLPKVVRAGTDLGPILPEAARQFGLPSTCRFVVGCLDQYAGAIGAGNVAPGMVSETTGTVLATVRCSDRFSTSLDNAVYQGPAFHPNWYWRMVFGNTSARYLQWYCEQLPDQPSFDQLTAEAATIGQNADGLRLNTDAPLTDVAAVFPGLTKSHTRGHFVRCILEAVAGALRDQVEALCDDTSPKEIRCAGGGARSDLWLQIKADRLKTTTVATTCPEPTSLGAAILAKAALDGADVRMIADKWVALKTPHRPMA
jgi:xylulokinase